jgi:hypothetical protein
MYNIGRRGSKQIGQSAEFKTSTTFSGLCAAAIVRVAHPNQFGARRAENRVDVLAGNVSATNDRGLQET